MKTLYTLPPFSRKKVRARKLLLRKRNAAIRLNLSFCAREERKCCGVRVRGENKTFTVTLSFPEAKILANELVLGLAPAIEKWS